MYPRRVTYGLSENAKMFIIKYCMEKKVKQKLEAIKNGDR